MKEFLSLQQELAPRLTLPIKRLITKELAKMGNSVFGTSTVENYFAKPYRFGTLSYNEALEKFAIHILNNEDWPQLPISSDNAMQHLLVTGKLEDDLIKIGIKNMKSDGYNIYEIKTADLT